MYVNFPPASRTTRVDDERIRDLTAAADTPDGHAVERDGPEDESAMQVTQELGEYLMGEWGFVEHDNETDDERDTARSTLDTSTTDTSASDDEATASTDGGDA